MPLGQDLVDAAALADLVFDLLVFIVPVRLQRRGTHERVIFALKRFDDAAILQIDALEVILAIEEMLVRPCLAFLKDGLIFSRSVRFAQMRRHLGTGFERAQVEAGEPRVGAKEFHVERVVLASPENARFLRVPAVDILRTPGKFQ